MTELSGNPEPLDLDVLEALTYEEWIEVNGRVIERDEAISLLIERVRFHSEQETGLRDDIGNLEAELASRIEDRDYWYKYAVKMQGQLEDALDKVENVLDCKREEENK